jgi:hypothetical protein
MPKLTVKSTLNTAPIPHSTPPIDWDENIINELKQQLKEQEELIGILRKKVQEKPSKNHLDLDIDSILIFIQSLQIDQHPSLKSTLLQLQKYGKKALIIEVISIIKLWQAGHK